MLPIQKADKPAVINNNNTKYLKWFAIALVVGGLITLVALCPVVITAPSIFLEKFIVAPIAKVIGTRVFMLALSICGICLFLFYVLYLIFQKFQICLQTTSNQNKCCLEEPLNLGNPWIELQNIMHKQLISKPIN